MLSRAQNTFHHNPRLRGPVSSSIKSVYVLYVNCKHYVSILYFFELFNVEHG